MKDRDGPEPIDVRQGWHRQHRLIQGWFGGGTLETATECFAPIDLNGARMQVVDLRFLIRRPPVTGQAGTVTGGIYQARFAAPARGRAPGADNIDAEGIVGGIRSFRMTRTSDLQAATDIVTLAFDNPIDLRPDIPWLVYIRLDGPLRYTLDPHSFGSAPMPYTGAWPRRATLNRRMSSTTIYGPAFELRSAYGRFYFGDPATEK